jgi:hypothetical protein
VIETPPEASLDFVLQIVEQNIGRIRGTSRVVVQSDRWVVGLTSNTREFLSV